MNGWDCLNTPDPFSVKPGNELYTVDKQSSALIYRYFDVIKAIDSTAPSIKHTALAFYKPTRLAYEWLIWVFALTLITSCSACIRSSQKVSRCQSACIYTVLCFMMSYLCATAASHNSWVEGNHKRTWNSAKSGSWQRAISVSCSSSRRMWCKSCTLVINALRNKDTPAVAITHEYKHTRAATVSKWIRISLFRIWRAVILSFRDKVKKAELSSPPPFLLSHGKTLN